MMVLKKSSHLVNNLFLQNNNLSGRDPSTKVVINMKLDNLTLSLCLHRHHTKLLKIDIN